MRNCRHGNRSRTLAKLRLRPTRREGTIVGDGLVPSRSQRRAPNPGDHKGRPYETLRNCRHGNRSRTLARLRLRPTRREGTIVGDGLVPSRGQRRATNPGDHKGRPYETLRNCRHGNRSRTLARLRLRPTRREGTIVGDGLVPSRSQRRATNPGDHKGRPYETLRNCRHGNRSRTLAKLRLRPTRRESTAIAGDGLVPSRSQRRATNPGDHKGRPYETLRNCRHGNRSRTLARLRLRPTRRESTTVVGDGLVPSRSQRRATNPGDRKGRPYETLRNCRHGNRSRTLAKLCLRPTRREGTIVGDGLVPSRSQRRAPNPGDHKGRPYETLRNCRHGNRSRTLARLRLRPTRRESTAVVGDGLVPSRGQRRATNPGDRSQRRATNPGDRSQRRATNPGDHKGRPYETLLDCRYGGLRTMLIVALALPAWSPVLGVDGPAIAEQCDQCHGPSGRSEDSEVPSIGGFSEYAIIDLLETFRIGLRQGRPIALPDGTETDMVEISRALSDEEIEAVAVHYSLATWHPHQQTFDAALAKRGAEIHREKCDKCHSEGGSVADDDLAVLAGQWREYLKMEFEDFDRGARRMVDKMKAKFETLSDEDKAALLEFYVSGGDP